MPTPAFLCRADLLDVVNLVRGQLTSLQRATLGALVVMDVHARDVVTQLAEAGVHDESDFGWQAQLRSYWDDDEVRGKSAVMRMMSARLDFGCASILCRCNLALGCEKHGRSDVSDERAARAWAP